MEQIEQPEEDVITIRYAETDDDVIAIHQFLLIVGAPKMRAPVDPIASLQEIIRVTADEVAIMAIKDGRLVGTLGLMHVGWWYNPGLDFMTERWHFVLPQFHNSDVDRLLIEEADIIADSAGIEFIEMGPVRERRGRRKRLFLLPRTSTSESDNLDERRA